MTRVNNYSKQTTESEFVSTLHPQMLSYDFFSNKRKLKKSSVHHSLKIHLLHYGLSKLVDH